MDKDNRYSHDPPPGIPKVPPEVIDTFLSQPHNLDTEYKQLQRENPHLAQAIMKHAEQYSRNIRLKRAFGTGALFIYGILAAGAETHLLEQLFGESTTDDDDVEDRPPLT